MSASVFPARAGMSPWDYELTINQKGVPRASGDEPKVGAGANPYQGCSPRERG